MVNSVKVPAQRWVEEARRTLSEEGIEAVKVDRLAQRIGVSRGGFYHHFVDRADLLSRLLKLWYETILFVPLRLVLRNPADALRAVDEIVDHLIREDIYDPRFDLAVREWARSDPTVAVAVAGVDAKRIAALYEVFLAFGCGKKEADLRARVFYFHQIGYYAIGIDEPEPGRRERARTYVEILCGEANIARASAPAAGRKRKRA
ncbi:TetR/AcrR family transcriptional regulator [Roseateles violae]|uniref:Helix-turn-helix domain-containing protein n=1 Tax=Roseateles violae TaxID=3058042 RepID=A0ABT8DV36_9BURK|nr:TetR/AcrR family transcriptional regulator [Pelomonas sp. PFR6]MDN3922149.1 helix-turn-helix domain-containing protein [Pelomonas sp. PFR6]